MLFSGIELHSARIVGGPVVQRRELGDKALETLGAILQRAEQSVGIASVEHVSVLYGELHSSQKAAGHGYVPAKNEFASRIC